MLNKLVEKIILSGYVAGTSAVHTFNETKINFEDG